mgnify:CR=1 FL=1
MLTAQNKILVPSAAPTDEQRRWLGTGLNQPGGKLPLYDEKGTRVSAELITACVQAGWAEPWALNPTRTDNQVCRLTEAGRQALQKDKEGVIRVDFSMWRRDSGEVDNRTLAEKALRH